VVGAARKGPFKAAAVTERPRDRPIHAISAPWRDGQEAETVRWRCEDCNHEWTAPTRGKGAKPTHCPACRNEPSGMTKPEARTAFVRARFARPDGTYVPLDEATPEQHAARRALQAHLAAPGPRTGIVRRGAAGGGIVWRCIDCGHGWTTPRKGKDSKPIPMPGMSQRGTGARRCLGAPR
jgi:rubrerythrin